MVNTTVMNRFDFCREAAEACANNVRLIDEISFIENCYEYLPTKLGNGITGSFGKRDFSFEMSGRNNVLIKSEFDWNKSSAGRNHAMSHFCDDFDPPPSAPIFASVDDEVVEVDFFENIADLPHRYEQSLAQTLLQLTSSQGESVLSQASIDTNALQDSITPANLLANPASILNLPSITSFLSKIFFIPKPIPVVR